MPTTARGTLTAAGWLALATLACGGESTGPEGPASVSVTSPIDTVLAVGGTAQLSATARDADGGVLAGQTFTWQTSSPSVIQVGTRGLATAQSTGTATITATASGVSGTLRLRVVAADLPQVGTLAGDAFAQALVGASPSNAQATWSSCVASAEEGNVLAVQACVDDIRALAGSATGNERALLAVLTLFAEEIERQLGL